MTIDQINIVLWNERLKWLEMSNYHLCQICLHDPLTYADISDENGPIIPIVAVDFRTIVNMMRYRRLNKDEYDKDWWNLFHD